MKKEEQDNNYSFDEFLEKQGYLIYTGVGYSMMPLLRQKKDVIEIRKKTSGRCKKYDVVLYKRDKKYILHRILKVFPDRYIIAGDHNTFLDTPITDDMIIGVMTRIIRNGKTITTDNIWYKIYVHIWCDFYPIRMMLLKIKRFIKRKLVKIKKRIARLFIQKPKA